MLLAPSYMKSYFNGSIQHTIYRTCDALFSTCFSATSCKTKCLMKQQGRTTISSRNFATGRHDGHSKNWNHPQGSRQQTTHDVTKYTSVIISGVPPFLTQHALILMFEEVSAFMPGAFDFFYCPWDPRKKSNLGYAIVNFFASACAQEFRSSWDNARLPPYKVFDGCRKELHVTPWALQGRETIFRHFSYMASAYDEVSLFGEPLLRSAEGAPLRPTVFGANGMQEELLSRCTTSSKKLDIIPDCRSRPASKSGEAAPEEVMLERISLDEHQSGQLAQQLKTENLTAAVINLAFDDMGMAEQHRVHAPFQHLRLDKPTSPDLNLNGQLEQYPKTTLAGSVHLEVDTMGQQRMAEQVANPTLWQRPMRAQFQTVLYEKAASPDQDQSERLKQNLKAATLAGSSSPKDDHAGQQRLAEQVVRSALLRQLKYAQWQNMVLEKAAAHRISADVRNSRSQHIDRDDAILGQDELSGG